MIDQNSQFFAILTAVGEAKQANADALGIPWKLTHLGVGDANGTEPIPDRLQTKLINERRRAPLNQLKIDPANPAVLIAEQVIPPDVGGWWVREIGLYDEAGDLVAIANCAPSFKPVLSQGSGRTQIVRMNFIVSSVGNIVLKIDPAVVLATREYVDSSIIAAINKQDFKRSVMVATTANIVLSGAQTIDGQDLPAGTRVLVKDQVTGKDNGIYLTAAGAWARAEDADASIEVTPGLLVHVEQGALNADTVWQLITDAPIVLGTTALVFERALGPTGLVAGTYRQVKVNKYGQVEEGANPTTLSGFGIQDALTKTQINTALNGKADKATTLLGYGITDAYTKAESDALASRVVSLPAVSGSSSARAGTNVTLTASASSLLVGGSIVSFTWMLPDGTVSTTAATSGSASKVVVAKGSIGTNYVVSVFATDSAGNKSAVATKAISITDHTAPTAPTTVNIAASVFQGSTGNILTASGATASDGATITYSISQSGEVALGFSRTTGIAAGEVVTFSVPSVAADTPITISVVAVDSMGGVSSAKAVSVTIAAVPSQPGVPYGGGYYVGRIKPGDGNTYALIVAPKASGEPSSNLSMKPAGTTTAGTSSTWDGAANTAAMIAAGAAAHPAASFCAGLNIGGYTDWAIPARDQLELLYRNLKPTTTANSTTTGANTSSDPVGANYTAGSPAQTDITAFKVGGAEAFQTSVAYWSSTEYSSTFCRIQSFSNGLQDANGKTGGCPLRAVRMIKI